MDQEETGARTKVGAEVKTVNVAVVGAGVGVVLGVAANAVWELLQLVIAANEQRTRVRHATNATEY